MFGDSLFVKLFSAKGNGRWTFPSIRTARHWRHPTSVLPLYYDNPSHGSFTTLWKQGSFTNKGNFMVRTNRKRTQGGRRMSHSWYCCSWLFLAFWNHCIFTFWRNVKGRGCWKSIDFRMLGTQRLDIMSFFGRNCLIWVHFFHWRTATVQTVRFVGLWPYKLATEVISPPKMWSLGPYI